LQTALLRSRVPEPIMPQIFIVSPYKHFTKQVRNWYISSTKPIHQIGIL
jgi:hypothetical protein